MKERIKSIRKALGLTQQEMADKLGIKRTSISNYEIGRNEPPEPVISLFRREFGISEEWLKTGEGDMYERGSGDFFDDLIKKYRLDQSDRAMLESFCQLKSEDRKAILRFVKLAGEYMDEDDMDVTTAAEAAYAEALGFAPSTESSVSNSTEDIQSIKKESLLDDEEA